jgi:alkylhydroperoxidase family enzyme
MPRIPYKPHDNAGPEEVVGPIRARRGGKLMNLDRMILHSVPFTAGWGTFLRAVRTELSLSAKIRELAMCAVSALTNTEYELHHHEPHFLSAGGTKEQFDALADVRKAAQNTKLFDATDRAVLQLALEMTENVAVSDATFAAARNALGDDERQTVELVGVIAAYNMVTRFVMALGIELE